MALVRSLESVPFSRYFWFCNVLGICNTQAIPTYRVYRLYDIAIVTNWKPQRWQICVHCKYCQTVWAKLHPYFPWMIPWLEIGMYTWIFVLDMYLGSSKSSSTLTLARLLEEEDMSSSKESKSPIAWYWSCSRGKTQLLTSLNRLVIDVLCVQISWRWTKV